MWLAAVVYIVIRKKYAKFEVNMFAGIEDISIRKQNLTNADANAGAGAIALWFFEKQIMV